MKGFIHAALAATLVAGVAAQPHAHQRHHANPKRHERAVVEKRDVTVTSVVPATVTVYVLDGKEVDVTEAKKGIDGGDYIVVGSSTPTFTPPPPPSSTSSLPASSSAALGGQFFEQKQSSSSSAAASSSAPAPSAPAPSAPAPSAPAPPPAASSPSAAGIGTPFPSGIPCSSFPSQFGAVPLDWLNLDGWASIQTPSNGFTPGVAVVNIVTPDAGACTPGSFCVPACPPGYMSTQWPEDSQGATGQSVGGLWCGADNTLHLTRPEYPTLCIPSAGGVFVKNSLDVQVSACQTVYPGTENMVIPTAPQPGQTLPLTNPDANKAYWWQGNPTSAQHYLNPKGMAPGDCCKWKNPNAPDSSGNWSPMIIGAGQDVHGITYLSLFLNLPTSTAKLDFNVRITGDINAPCSWENGAFSNGPGNGCTTAISKPGGVATIEFY